MRFVIWRDSGITECFPTLKIKISDDYRDTILLFKHVQRRFYKTFLSPLQYEISLINELSSVWYCTLYQTNVFMVLFKIGPSRVNKKKINGHRTFSSRPVLGNTNKGPRVSKIYVQWLSHAGLWDWRGCSQWHVTDWSPNHMTAGDVWPSPARKIISMITMHRSQYSRIYRWHKECFLTVHHLINLGRWTNLHQRHFIVWVENIPVPYPSSTWRRR